MAPGTELDVLTGLGNGYDVSRSGERPLLVGGGVGIPPLYGLARRLVAQGKHVTAVLGFNRASEIFLAEEFRALGAEVVIATADGSAGHAGPGDRRHGRRFRLYVSVHLRPGAHAESGVRRL